MTPAQAVPLGEAAPFAAARMSSLNQWETIADVKRDAGSDTTQRLKVAGGWIYRTVIVEKHDHRQAETSIAMCFVRESSA